MACCNSSSTEEIHQSETPWNGFNYNHCGRISSACKRRMTQEVCMYECDPYLKNWIVSVIYLTVQFLTFMNIYLNYIYFNKRIRRKKCAQKDTTKYRYVRPTVITGSMHARMISLVEITGAMGFYGEEVRNLY